MLEAIIDKLMGRNSVKINLQRRKFKFEVSGKEKLPATLYPFFVFCSEEYHVRFSCWESDVIGRWQRAEVVSQRKFDSYNMGDKVYREMYSHDGETWYFKQEAAEIKAKGKKVSCSYQFLVTQTKQN